MLYFGFVFHFIKQEIFISKVDVQKSRHVELLLMKLTSFQYSVSFPWQMNKLVRINTVKALMRLHEKQFESPYKYLM